MKRNKLWLIGLALLTVLAITVWGQVPSKSFSLRPSALELSAQAQSSSTEVSPAPDDTEVNPSPVEPIPTGAPALPGPLPPVPQLTESPSVLTLPLSGDYQDPGDRFQVGILEGYKVSSIGNAPLIESGDGSLAYTVVVLPQVNGQPFDQFVTDAALAQAAQQVFQRGEGFQTTGFQTVVQGGTLISWTGSLTIGGQTQPIEGVILARQAAGTIFLLLVAATETGVDQVSSAIATLANSLQIL